jgi:uncharacterized protein
MASIIHEPPAVFYVKVGDINVTNSMNKYLISIKIRNEHGTHATASLVFDDSNGQLIIPNSDELVTIGLGWQDTGPVTVFNRGRRIESISMGSRSHGRTLAINLTGADLTATGVIKSQSDQYADKMNLQDVANKFNPIGWNTLVKGNLAQLSRDYWSMNNQTFPSWINKIATEVGGAVICNDKTFVIYPVGSDQGLPVIECDCGEGGNVIEWNIIPDSDLLKYAGFQTLAYDNAAASLLNDMGDTSSVTAINKSKAPTSDQATVQSTANEHFGRYESKRGRLTIVGEPSAAISGWINLNGTRAAVDGYYAIKSVEHEYNRSGGFRTTLELRNPVASAPTQTLAAGDFNPPS